MPPAALILGFVPVLIFLAALMLMDSYKLTPRRAVVLSLAVGALVAVIALFLNRTATDVLGLPPWALRRYLAPLVEEVLKAAFVLALVRSGRVGFMVDAGIHGFAVGTGFALLENLYYATALADGRLTLWLVRGLGTAVMHGSTTAMVAVLTKGLTDRHGSFGIARALPGLALALVTHSFFNHLVLNPLLTTALLLVTMPLLLLAVFERSDRAARAWLGAGLDDDLAALESLLDTEVQTTPIGRFLESLKTHFDPTVVADMLCLLRIHLELALSAKGVLLARSAGIDIPPDEHVRANFEELRYLERAIGPTGLLAIHPLRKTRVRDLWELHVLRR